MKCIFQPTDMHHVVFISHELTLTLIPLEYLLTPPFSSFCGGPFYPLFNISCSHQLLIFPNDDPNPNPNPDLVCDTTLVK